MNYFDNELHILEWFRNTWEQHVLIPYTNPTCTELYLSLSDEKRFGEWINSAGKADPPPDFYNPKSKWMMDVMRIDDHGHTNPKGKYVNPVNQRENLIHKELQKSGLLDAFPSLQSVFVNAVTNLPSEEDHNYSFYLETFKRIVNKHIDSIPIYKTNHPNYATIFFVFDESGGYVLAENEAQAKKKIEVGEPFYCKPYLHFADKRFVEIFAHSDIDYLIWFSPFKHIESDMPEAPTVCIYDVKKIKMSDFIDYPKALIMSAEA